jgi:hypothetical protein
MLTFAVVSEFVGLLRVYFLLRAEYQRHMLDDRTLKLSGIFGE